MKYVLIVGATENGKSTTINEVCKKLQPTKSWVLNSEGIYINIEADIGMFNGTYLIEVNGVIILVAAGSPTEQDITITDLFKLAIQLGFDVKILIVAMRTSERKPSFDTPKELQKLGKEIYCEKIFKIDGDYKANSDWKDRIDRIVFAIKMYL